MKKTIIFLTLFLMTATLSTAFIIPIPEPPPPPPDEPRTIGYWKHQVNGNGKTFYTVSELLDFSQYIFDHFYLNPVNPIQIEGVTFVIVGTTPSPLELVDLQYIMNINQGTSTLYQRACQQLMALLLNVASEKLSQLSQVSEDGATVSQAIVYIDEIIEVESELAKDIAETLNEGDVVEAGVIPLTTLNIIFGNGLEAVLHLPSFEFSEPVPNPFNPATCLRFNLVEAGEISLVIYDLRGREIARLADGFHSAGKHQITFNASQLSSGVYFACLKMNGLSQTRKILLVK